MPSAPPATASTKTRASLAVTVTLSPRAVGVFRAAGTCRANCERYSTPTGEAEDGALEERARLVRVLVGTARARHVALEHFVVAGNADDDDLAVGQLGVAAMQQVRRGVDLLESVGGRGPQGAFEDTALEVLDVVAAASDERDLPGMQQDCVMELSWYVFGSTESAQWPYLALCSGWLIS